MTKTSKISLVSLSELDKDQRWDAEAFSPYLRDLDKNLAQSPLLASIATITHPAEITRVYSDADDSVAFMRAQNIKPYLPETGNIARIPLLVARDLPTNRMERGDVVVTRSGAFSGVAAAFLGEGGSCYASGEAIIVRSLGGIEGEYLAVFLNTRAGRALCRRAIYGSGQPHIGPKYLEKMRIPRLGHVEAEVSRIVRNAYAKLEASKGAYPRAEAELLERIGWQGSVKRSTQKSYIRNFSDVSLASRFDPEFYRTEPNSLRKSLKKDGAMSVGDLCTFVEHGLQPPYVDGGNIGIVSQRQFRATGLDLDLLENFTTEQFIKDNPLYEIRKGDVLTYCVSAGEYLGRTFIFDSGASCVAASFVSILRTEMIVPGYLALFLNSPAGLLQSNMFKRGTTPFYLYPRDLKQVLVPVPRTKSGKIDLVWQERLAEEIEGVNKAKVAARSELRKANDLVEEAIGRVS